MKKELTWRYTAPVILTPCKYEGCQDIFLSAATKINWPRLFCSRECYYMYQVRRGQQIKLDRLLGFSYTANISKHEG